MGPAMPDGAPPARSAMGPLPALASAEPARQASGELSGTIGDRPPGTQNRAQNTARNCAQGRPLGLLAHPLSRGRAPLDRLLLSPSSSCFQPADLQSLHKAGPRARSPGQVRLARSTGGERSRPSRQRFAARPATWSRRWAKASIQFAPGSMPVVKKCAARGCRARAQPMGKSPPFQAPGSSSDGACDFMFRSVLGVCLRGVSWVGGLTCGLSRVLVCVTIPDRPPHHLSAHGSQHTAPSTWLPAYGRPLSRASKATWSAFLVPLQPWRWVVSLLQTIGVAVHQAPFVLEPENVRD